MTGYYNVFLLNHYYFYSNSSFRRIYVMEARYNVHLMINWFLISFWFLKLLFIEYILERVSCDSTLDWSVSFLEEFFLFGLLVERYVVVFCLVGFKGEKKEDGGIKLKTVWIVRWCFKWLRLWVLHQKVRVQPSALPSCHCWALSKALNLLCSSVAVS